MKILIQTTGPEQLGARTKFAEEKSIKSGLMASEEKEGTFIKILKSFNLENPNSDNWFRTDNHCYRILL